MTTPPQKVLPNTKELLQQQEAKRLLATDRQRAADVLLELRYQFSLHTTTIKIVR